MSGVFDALTLHKPAKTQTKSTNSVRSENKNLKNSELVNFSLDNGSYKVYNADYNNVTMR